MMETNDQPGIHTTTDQTMGELAESKKQINLRPVQQEIREGMQKLLEELQQEVQEFQQEAQEFSIEKEDGSAISYMENPFNPKDIDIISRTMSMDNIIKRLKENEIDLAPEFQRSMNLWEPKKQSQLIESILINFPLPAFYFDGSDKDKWLVVDGLQRLSTLNNFVVKKTLKLTGLEFLDKLDGAGFDDLPRMLQRQIEEAQIVAYIINPGTPDEVKFNIFKRINTGGLVLEPQEIRHALNQGVPAKVVAELADYEEFKEATQYIIPSLRMSDREFTTRFVAFYINSPHDYKPDLDTFLNKSMRKIKELSSTDIEQLKSNFKEAMKLAQKIFGRYAFRKVFDTNKRRKPINKALFEVWSVSLAKLSGTEREIIAENTEQVFQDFVFLMNNDATFVSAITSATGDKTRVAYRFSKIDDLLKKNVEQ